VNTAYTWLASLSLPLLSAHIRSLGSVCPPRPFAASMPRTRSASVSGNWLERDRRQNNTIGIPGYDSPRGRRRLCELWYALKDQHILCRPRIQVSNHGEGGLILAYVMLFWHPMPLPGMLQPERWHATLVRFACPASVQMLANLVALEETLGRVLTALAQGEAQHTLTLAFSPWGSWAFGISGASSGLCEALRSSALFMIQHRFGAAVGEQRQLHVSWH